MHKSRLAGFIIDCQTDDLDAAASFWTQALGYRLRAEPDDGRYRVFDTGPGGLHIEVQRVEHPSRVHLDIETDDIEAEVARLEKLGARRVQKFPRWWVMEAPTGQRFCVVRPQSPEFQEKANRWD
ncbi:MAG TPA: VOC family protein [Steroidobacteraceae bacterium]|nr:VOC family protein [Steroidobacteraceae bacterium]